MSRRFYASCITLGGPNPGEAIQNMTRKAVMITRRTFLKHVNRNDLRELEKQLGYFAHPSQGLTMARDWHPSYWVSKLGGETVYYFDHSRIEYIFRAD